MYLLNIYDVQFLLIFIWSVSGSSNWFLGWWDYPFPFESHLAFTH